jgi:arsenate reductase (thioredoxin)
MPMDGNGMMTHRFAAGLSLLLVAAPHVGSAQRATPQKTVLFVCEHGTVKSLMAKLYFEQYAKEAGLSMQAVSRGTHIDSVVPPWMVKGLADDHLSIGGFRPRSLAGEDLAEAAYVVSFDVPASATAAAGAPREQWDGLPSVTQNYAAGRDAIKARVRALVDSLKRATRTAPDRL